MSLTGKSAVVTGAAVGIGRAVSEALLENGAKVALLDVNETAGQSLMESLNEKHGAGSSIFLKCNVQSDEQMKAAFQKTIETFGGVDILCNNAGILDEQTWEQTISINLMGVIRGSYLALEQMSTLSGGRGGVIINMASMAGLGPLPSCPVYTAAKSGVVGFTRAMAAAITMSDSGVRFNAVCPGFVKTDLLKDLPQKLGQFAHMHEAVEKSYKTAGMISVSEVAEAFMELVTDETKNGEALMVFAKGKSYMKFPSLIK